MIRGALLVGTYGRLVSKDLADGTPLENLARAIKKSHAPRNMRSAMGRFGEAPRAALKTPREESSDAWKQQVWNCGQSRISASDLRHLQLQHVLAFQCAGGLQRGQESGTGRLYRCKNSLRSRRTGGSSGSLPRSENRRGSPGLKLGIASSGQSSLRSAQLSAKAPRETNCARTSLSSDNGSAHPHRTRRAAGLKPACSGAVGVVPLSVRFIENHPCNIAKLSGRT
jgi:hypothetical protein